MISLTIFFSFFLFSSSNKFIQNHSSSDQVIKGQKRSRKVKSLQIFNGQSNIIIGLCFSTISRKKLTLYLCENFKNHLPYIDVDDACNMRNAENEMCRWQVWDVGDIENIINMTKKTNITSPTSLSPWIYSKYDHSLKLYPGHLGQGRWLLIFLIFSVLDIGNTWLVV